MKILLWVGAGLLAIGMTACSLTPAQQQSAALYQQAVASGQRPMNVVGVVKTFDTGTGILQLYDTITYLVPASTGGHQMPTDVVGPLITGDHVRLSYVLQGGQRVVTNLEKENLKATTCKALAISPRKFLGVSSVP